MNATRSIFLDFFAQRYCFEMPFCRKQYGCFLSDSLEIISFDRRKKFDGACNLTNVHESVTPVESENERKLAEYRARVADCWKQMSRLGNFDGYLLCVSSHL